MMCLSLYLSLGYTNYSYKIFIADRPELTLFAKLSFERAVWHPDKDAHHDLQRSVNEFDLTERFSKIKPDCIASPLALWDVEHDDQKMKLLVTEWSQADEQFANQFIDGSIDPRIAQPLANALAALHSIDNYDPSFNEQIKPFMSTQYKLLEDAIQDKARTSEPPQDRVEKICAMIGEDILMKILDANHKDFYRRDCLIHSDSHSFNILVEAKPDEQDLNLFESKGALTLCDWEMAMIGPQGRDAGLVIAWPLACKVSHALCGHVESNESIQIRLFVHTFLTSYFSEIATDETEEELAQIYRQCVGWCGWFMLVAFWKSNAFLGDAPGCEDEKSREYVRESMGVLGLKLMRLSYDKEYVPEKTTLNELTVLFNMLVDEEVTQAYANSPTRPVQRRSSLLRSSNRRISDAATCLGTVQNFF